MVKDVFKDDKFTFHQWIRLFNQNDWMTRVFNEEWIYAKSSRKRPMLLKSFKCSNTTKDTSQD